MQPTTVHETGKKIIISIAASNMCFYTKQIKTKKTKKKKTATHIRLTKW